MVDLKKYDAFQNNLKNDSNDDFLSGVDIGYEFLNADTDHYCTICNKLMRNPHQTECGCLGCHECLVEK